MSKNLYNLLVSFPGEEHVKKTCKMGQGEKTCRYLAVGGKGFECSKASSLRHTIDKRFEEGTMNAKGDNCDGPLGIIMENQASLHGNKLQYRESMPSYESEGTLDSLYLSEGVLGIKGDWKSSELKGDLSMTINMLDISITPTSISFGVAGLGAFAGRTTIFI